MVLVKMSVPVATLKFTGLKSGYALRVVGVGVEEKDESEEEENTKSEHCWLRNGPRIYTRMAPDIEDDGPNDSPVESESALLDMGDSDATSEPGFQRTDWRSIYVGAFIAFCSAVQFGLYFASMWPYLETIDSEATEQFFGFIIAVYSVATCIASPLFGYWSNKIHQIRLPMNVGIACMVSGNVIYLSCELLPSNRRYALLLARFLTGIGSANIPLLRAYASTACNPKDRPRAVSMVTGGIALGIMIGPAIQLLFSPIAYPGFVIFENFSISMYTASAYGAVVMNLISYLLLRCLFVEKYAGIHGEKKDSEDSDDEPGKVKVPPYDKIGAFVCNWTRFAQQFAFTNTEIVGAPYAMTVFAFTKQETVQIVSTAQSGMGIMGVVIFILFIGLKLNKHVKYRIGCIAAFSLYFLFFVITFPWPFLPGEISMHRDIDLVNAANEVVGCNVDQLEWCSTTQPVNPWLYFITFVATFGVGYPITDICLNTVYGRLLGPRRQGTMQGLLQVSGGFSRIIGPISIASLYRVFGPKGIWILELSVVGFTLLLWAIFYKHMAALKVPNLEKPSLSVVDSPNKKNPNVVHITDEK